MLGSKDQLGLQALSDVLSELPDSISTLPEYSVWVAKLVQHIGDVHALLTSPEELQLFRGLPMRCARGQPVTS